MIDTIVEMFSYPFMVRAFAVGSLVALCAALLGVSLVLKQYSMIGAGLSQVGFGALAVATAFQAAPLSVAIPVVVLAAVLILRIKGNGKIKGDAAIALISTTSLALGVMVISMTTGMNTDVSLHHTLRCFIAGFLQFIHPLFEALLKRGHRDNPGILALLGDPPVKQNVRRFQPRQHFPVPGQK